MRKISSALRASVRESGEAVVDGNAIRIFEQEILDAEKSIRLAKVHLSQVMAERFQMTRDIAETEKNIQKRQSQAIAAMDKHAQGVAEEIAEDILEKRASLKTLEEAIKELVRGEEGINASIRTAAQQIRKYRHELALAKAANSAGAAFRHAGGQSLALDNCLADLKDSSSRIRARQVRSDDSAKAMQMIDSTLGENGLEGRLQEVGIGDQRAAARELLQVLRRDSEPAVSPAAADKTAGSGESR
jgi:phage shock protein A